MKHKDALDAEETIEYVMSCWDDEAGGAYYKSPTVLHPPSFTRTRVHPARTTFQKGAHPGHDAHILSTLSAIQVLATHDALSRLSKPRVVDCSSPSFLYIC
jgi:geranylgeranyl transferase type-2 subunit beta